MSAKHIVPLLLSMSWLGASSVLADSQPVGKLIELHSCEVYAGGCVVSSESPQESRYMLQVWDLTGGSWQGVDLTGLKAAVLETSSQNLADAGASPESAVVYFPTDASAAQRGALMAWLKSSDGKLAGASIQTRVTPISLASSGAAVQVKVGEFATLNTASLGECKDRSCGEDLWYAPAIKTSRFTVAVNEDSRVAEPLLQLNWSDSGRRSVFVAHFGESNRNLFVNSADWCGLAGQLF